MTNEQSETDKENVSSARYDSKGTYKRDKWTNNGNKELQGLKKAPSQTYALTHYEQHSRKKQIGKS